MDSEITATIPASQSKENGGDSKGTQFEAPVFEEDYETASESDEVALPIEKGEKFDEKYEVLNGELKNSEVESEKNDEKDENFDVKEKIEAVEENPVIESEEKVEENGKGLVENEKKMEDLSEKSTIFEEEEKKDESLDASVESETVEKSPVFEEEAKVEESVVPIVDEEKNNEGDIVQVSAVIEVEEENRSPIDIGAIEKERDLKPIEVEHSANDAEKVDSVEEEEVKNVVDEGISSVVNEGKSKAVVMENLKHVDDEKENQEENNVAMAEKNEVADSFEASREIEESDEVEDVEKDLSVAETAKNETFELDIDGKPVLTSPLVSAEDSKSNVESPPVLVETAENETLELDTEEKAVLTVESPPVVAEDSNSNVDLPTVIAEDSNSNVEPPAVNAEDSTSNVEPPAVIAEDSTSNVEPPPVIAEDSNTNLESSPVVVAEDSNTNLQSPPVLAEDSISGTGTELVEKPNATESEIPHEISFEGMLPFSSPVKKLVADAVTDDDDDENYAQIEGEEEEQPRVAILDSSETAKQIIKEMEEVSSRTSFGSSHSYQNQIDGQIVTDSDEEVDTDEDGDGKELFDSAALAALLKAATGGGGSSDGNITITSQDGTRVFSMDRPAGLGSSAPSLRPGPARSTRPTLFSPSELTVTGEAENEMDEEEKKLHEKVEQIRVKFLRLIMRLGHTAEDTVAAQVLYRLSLAEGIRRGRQMGRAFSIETAKKKAIELEEQGDEDLNFSCNILVLGKSGVGKSATINSIFGEEKSHTNAFKVATTSVREISGVVDGVTVRVIDTPGLKSSVMDQATNRRILSSIKKYTKKCPPDIVLYVDRLDMQTRDFNDLPLLRSITSALGSSIWFNAIVALTHAASAPPEGPNGSSLTYEVFIAQRSHVVQHNIRQAAGDMRLMNPVALVENHPSCRRNREGERVLPNGVSWRPQMLLLCYSSKILAEANSLLKLQDPSPGKLFGFRLRSPPLPYLLSTLLQTRAHPKLTNDQGGDNGDSDIDLDDFSDAEDEEEDEYDLLPPFKPLKKSQLAKLTKEQKRAYFDEYDYRVKLLQKKQFKEEIRRLKEMKKRGKSGMNDSSQYGEMGEDFDQDGAPAAVPVPMPDMVLPPSFDSDFPTYRYRFLEPTSQLLTRPVLDTHGWDHDCGYDGVSLEESLAILGKFPAAVAVQITKDKKDFSIHLDSSVSAKHGENGSSLAGFDIQSVGKQLAYILRGETKFKNLKKNKTTAGMSVTFLGETVATGMKVEDQLMIGKRVGLVASMGAIRSQGDVAYGANLEARLREKDYPIGQALSTLGLSLMKWRGDLALGANLQTQANVGRNSKVAVRVSLNNKRSGQITVRTSSSEHLQLALVAIIPVAVSVYRTIWSGEPEYGH